MELRNLLDKSREIKLFDDELSVTYDPTAITLGEMGSVSNVQLIAKTVKAWNLSFDGKVVIPSVEDMTALPGSAMGVWREIAEAIYRDMAAFPKAKLRPPRASMSETGAATATANM